MGCNFYAVITSGDSESERHIGKRSASGYYCWDCDISLCASGHDDVHGSARFLDHCPVCGGGKETESIESSAAGRELGFNKLTAKRKSGVKGASSFSWAMTPSHFDELICAPNVHVRDEYGRSFTRDQFSEIMSECPIKFFRSIGVDFC